MANKCGTIGNFQQADPFHCKIERPGEPPSDGVFQEEKHNELPGMDSLGGGDKPFNVLNESFPEFVPVSDTNNPCYLPQPNDLMIAKDTQEPMGPIGPWATGKVDWSPLAGLTGTRPVVDRYSITRFSGAEWREHNRILLSNVTDQCLASLRFVFFIFINQFSHEKKFLATTTNVRTFSANQRAWLSRTKLKIIVF